MSEPATTICYFRGRDAETLTRDELLVAYRYACEELNRMRGWAAENAEMDRLFAATAQRLAKVREPVHGR